MRENEQFSWGKFFGGVVSPIGYFKTIADILRVLVIILLCWLAYMAGVKIHSVFSAKKPQPAVFNVAGQQGGCVKNSADQRESKFGLLNF